MNAMRRPLTNAELVYKAAYLELCSLYNNGTDGQAEKLAWRYYQDPHIPLILRIMCCSVLGEADGGEYLQFAREAVEHATTAWEQDPENETAQLMLKETKEVLKSAEEDAQEQLLVLPSLLEECNKTEAEANKLAADLEAQQTPAQPQNSESQPSIMSPSLPSAMSTPQMKPSSIFSPLSSPTGPSWMPEGSGSAEDDDEQHP